MRVFGLAEVTDSDTYKHQIKQQTVPCCHDLVQRSTIYLPIISESILRPEPVLGTCIDVTFPATNFQLEAL